MPRGGELGPDDQDAARPICRGKLDLVFLVRADQLAGWIYGQGVEDPGRMTNLPAELRERLGRDLLLHALELESLERSEDGTRKGVLRARDFLFAASTG